MGAKAGIAGPNEGTTGPPNDTGGADAGNSGIGEGVRAGAAGAAVKIFPLLALGAKSRHSGCIPGDADDDAALAVANTGIGDVDDEGADAASPFAAVAPAIGAKLREVAAAVGFESAAAGEDELANGGMPLPPPPPPVALLLLP